MCTCALYWLFFSDSLCLAGLRWRRIYSRVLLLPELPYSYSGHKQQFVAPVCSHVNVSVWYVGLTLLSLPALACNHSAYRTAPTSAPSLYLFLLVLLFPSLSFCTRLTCQHSPRSRRMARCFTTSRSGPQPPSEPVPLPYFGCTFALFLRSFFSPTGSLLMNSS